MGMKRRDFLQKSAAGLGGIMLGSELTAAERDGDTFDHAERVPLGNTGVKISRLGFGTGLHGWKQESDQTRLGRETFQSLLQFSYRNGITYFDAADLYGTHPYIHRALSDVPRESYTVVSKIWWRENGLKTEKRPGAEKVVKRFLQELDTDYIDVVQLHCVIDADWPTRLSDRMEGLDRLKEQGLIRAHGVSTHSIRALEAAAEQNWTDCVHARINPFGEKMDKGPRDVIPVLRRLHDDGKGVIAIKVLGEGAFQDNPEKVQQSVRLALSLDCVDTMAIGFVKREEMKNMAGRVARVPRDATADTSRLG